MSDELGKEKGTAKTLDERFANRPHTYWRLQEIADQMDQAIAKGATADEAEAMAIGQLQKLGGEMLADWVEAKQEDALKQARAKYPKSIKHVKKSNLVHHVRSPGTARAVAAVGQAWCRTAPVLPERRSAQSWLLATLAAGGSGFRC